MAFNFNVSSSESDLFYNATDEAITLFGVPLKYIRAENKNKDSILGEFQHQNYNAENVYEIYGKFESTTQFEGQDFYSKFGITIQDSMNIYVSDKTFVNLGFQPAVNDIVYWIDGKAALEITRASREQPETGFYVGGRQAIAWKLITHKYLFDNDKFDTGVEELDSAASISDEDNIKITDIDNAIEDILNGAEKSPWEI